MKPAYKIICCHEWQTQTWKNGGGVTHEIVRENVGSELSWRLSVAEVNQDGPFSLFPGIDRQIHLLEGNGFRLHANGVRVNTIDYRDQWYAFSGDEPLHCTLIDAGVKDLNMMTARHLWRANVCDTLLIDNDMYVEASDAPTILFCYEPLVLELESHGQFTLQRFDTLVITHGIAATVLAKERQTRFALIQLQSL